MGDIAIILVSPKGDANIGAAARAMKNFGICDLRLVNAVPHLTKAAYMWAVDAKDVLEGATSYSNLSDALEDRSMSFGFTRRIGRTRKMHMSLKDAAVKAAGLEKKARLALVFGTEDSGLSNDDLGQLDAIVSIRTSPKLPSLNLAQSVLLGCYEIFNLRQSTRGRPKEDRTSIEFVTKREISALLKRIGDTLSSLSYEDVDGQPLKTKIINQFNKIFGRAGLTQKDVRMFEGLCRRIGDTVSPAAVQK